MVKFTISEKENFTIVEFIIPNGIIEPNELNELKIPQVNPKKGVILSGRGPVWLHSYLAHEYHPCKWVAHFDPRLGGGIVAQSHVKEVKEGDIIPIE